MGEPIDIIISKWQERQTIISNNLMELYEHPYVKIIKSMNRDTINGYTGITKVKSLQCIKKLDDLWKYYSLLSDTIDKAININNKRTFLNNSEKEVKDFLKSPSIVFETQYISINNRSLLSTGKIEKKITLEELLNYMQNSFESVRKNINQIIQASEYNKLKLISIKAEITKLNIKLNTIGISEIKLFDLAKITQIERDPLQGMIELDKLVYNLEKYKVYVKSFEQEYKFVIQHLNKIENLLAELTILASKSKNVIDRSSKLFNYKKNIKPIISDEVLKSLKDWLQLLKNKLCYKNLAAIKIGTIKLEKECLNKLKIERENYTL